MPASPPLGGAPGSPPRADRIAVVADGRIVEVGTHDELMRQGALNRRLYDRQFDDSAGIGPTAGEGRRISPAGG